MADTQQENPNPPAQPATTQTSTKRGSATPDVFADGSTKAERDRVLQEKKDTDQLVKAAGDAERKARSDS